MVMVIAWNETSDTFDSALEEGARLTLSLGAAMSRNGDLAVDEERLRMNRGDERVRLYYQLIRHASEVVLRARGAPGAPFVTPGKPDDRFYNTWAEDELWRVYVLKHKDLDLQVQIGQHWDDRNELLSETIEELAWPALLLWLALGVFNWWIIRRLLRPLEQAARAIAAKSPDDLTPVPPVGQASEVAAILKALNIVLSRLSGALAAERRFTANAAHELRTPLAALGSKIQLMQRRYHDAAPGALQNDLQDLRSDLTRSTAQVENLLLLARLDPQRTADLPKEQVELDTLLREVVAACTPAAQARAITINLTQNAYSAIAFRRDTDASNEAASPTAKHGLYANRQLLFSALRNVVDNGVRYGRPGGRCTFT
jgi:two-component system sensor histidine kinase QseC